MSTLRAVEPCRCPLPVKREVRRDRWMLMMNNSNAPDAAPAMKTMTE
jgi:hypothetical protein